MTNLSYNNVILDPLHVGRWAKSQFGVKSSVVAVFMTHAVINENSNVSRTLNDMERLTDSGLCRCSTIT